MVNWRSHGNTNLEFDRGTNVIIGINGAGKSSVLEAIFFALFGPPEREYYKKVLREGAQKGRVELEIEVEGKNYRIVKEFSKDKILNAEIRGATTSITGRQSDVTAEVERILGMNAKLFKEAVYARQNEMAYILRDATPQERKKLFDSLIELSDFSNARQIMIKVRNRLKRELDILRSQDWETAVKNHEDAIKKAEKDAENIRKNIEELQARMQEAEKRLTLLKQKLISMKDLKQKLQDVKAKIAQIQGEISEKKRIIGEIRKRWGKVENVSEEDVRNLSEKLEHVRAKSTELEAIERELKAISAEIAENERRIASVETPNRSIDEVKGEINNLRKMLKDINEILSEKKAKAASASERRLHVLETIKDLETQLRTAKNLQTQIQKIIEEHGDVEKKIEEISGKITEISREIAAAESKVEQERAFLDALKTANACPVCGSPLDQEKIRALQAQHRKELTAAEASVEKLKQEEIRLKNALERLKQLEAQLKRLKQQMPNVDELARRKAEAEKEAARLETLQKEIQKAISDAEKELHEVEQKLSEREKEYEDLRKKYEAVRMAEMLRSKNEELKKRKKELEAEIEKIRAELGDADVKKMEESLERMKDMLTATKLEKEINMLEKKIEELQEEKNHLENVEEEYIQTEREISSVSRAMEGYRALIAVRQQELARLQESIERERQAIETARTNIQKMAKLESAIIFAEKMESALGGTQEVVRKARILAINKVLNIVWREIYPGRDMPELRLRPTERDYVLEAKRKTGTWVPVTNLSGGEFYDAAISLRIAISAIKSRNLGWLLLDEPTHNLDEDASLALARFLSKLPEIGLFNQIIVITHDETFRSAATGKTYVFTRDKAKGRPTKVDEL